MSRASNSSAAPLGQQHAIQVVSNTWARDSHDLFDFESHQTESKTFTVRRSALCVRNGTEVDMAAEDGDAPLGKDPLIRVVERSGTFWVDKAVCASPSACPKKLWMVVRDVSPRGHKLSESDVIKLGRFKFRVRQLVTAEHGDVQPNLGLDDTSMCECCSDIHSEEMKSKTCRICLLEGPGEDDPLITPCMCKGSIEYVHLKCLRHWTNSRLNLPDSPLGSYFYRSLTCELCKTAYPAYMNFNNKRTPLMEVPQTQPPYVVLESMVRDTRMHNRGLHVISLAGKPLALGRGHSSDVRIADVSISRCHAMIRFQNGEFLLQDNDSKFGTLVAMKRPRQIDASRPLSLQIGRTVLSLSLTMADASGPPVSILSSQQQPLPLGVPSRGRFGTCPGDMSVTSPDGLPVDRADSTAEFVAPADGDGQRMRRYASF